MKALIASIALCVSFSANAYQSGVKISDRLEAAARYDAGTHRSGDESDRAYALGFIAGVHDLGDQILFCTPDTVTMKQVRLIVHSYFRAVPQRLNERAETLVTEALSVAYPCPDRNRRGQPL